MTVRRRHVLRIEKTLFRVHAADDEAKGSQPALKLFRKRFSCSSRRFKETSCIQF